MRQKKKKLSNSSAEIRVFERNAVDVARVVFENPLAMSFRMSSSSGEGRLSSSRYGERVPLRSLNNEILSTPSQRLKSKSQLSPEAGKMTMGDIPLCDSEPHLYSSPTSKVKQTSYPPSGLGDVTFKSFICAGGEVEIAESSMCKEKGMTSHIDAATCLSETEDTFVAQSMVEQLNSDPIEHAYYNPNVEDTFSVDRSEIPNGTLSFGGVENGKDAQDLQTCHTDCTWKSFVCDGGEVEVSDDSKPQDETVPLPMKNSSESSQLNSTYSANCSDVCKQLSQGEHVDHPYCFNKTHVCTTFSETPKESEEFANGLSDLTLKPFNCTSGEIEISEDAELAGETIPLPVSSCESHDYSVDPSVLDGDDGLQNDHLDHPYCNTKDKSSPLCGNSPTNQESIPCCSEAVKVEQMSFAAPEGQDVAYESVAVRSIILPVGEDEKSDDDQILEKPSSPPQDHDGRPHLIDEAVSTTLTQNHTEPSIGHLENNYTDLTVDNKPALTKASLKAEGNDTVEHQVQELSGSTEHPECSEDDPLPSEVNKTERPECIPFASSAESPVHQEVQQFVQYISQMCSSSGPAGSSEARDCALALSADSPVPCNSTEKPTEDFCDVLKVLSACPSVASALQLGNFSPALKRASLSVFKAYRNSPQNKFLADDSTLVGEKTLVAPVNANLTGFLTEHLENPMPQPLLNSTVIGYKTPPTSTANQDVDPGKKSEGIQLMPESQLQQQLRQMAEFLILASGQMGAAVASAPPPVFTAPTHRAAPVESHGVCVGTSPVKLVDHSLNTSGVFVRQREISVVDSCTATDPLIWNLPLCNLESLPREELEQRLMSNMIMIEALVQQLAAARAQGRLLAGPPPSDLREKLVQTDHTELSQTTMYRDLYTEALGRIRELDLDGSSLQNLIQSMQNMRASMSSLSSDTDSALFKMKEWRDLVSEDHHSLALHYQHMKSLLDESKDIQTRMMQKVKDALCERDDMRTQMEEAFVAKEAAFSGMEQLRIHCASEISALEKSVGSQQELLAALNQTYPEQVELNKTCSEMLNSASDLLSQTMEEHSSLMNELCTVRSLLQKTAPVLLLLKEKAAAALRERDEHRSGREQAVEERDQIEEELKETHLNLQTARQQIGDLNLQVTILSSEMGVLREKLTEKEEGASQLERKVTELSATISSTLASYTYLEQALDAETTKLQQSWKDVQQANESANQLKVSLEESEQQVSHLSQALAQSEDQVGQLQTLSESQTVQIQQLQDVCAQLKGVQEINEFLQMENELAREQVVESERMLSTNLQALRERNIECEDLKGEVCKLEVEKRSLHRELETTRSAVDASRLELEEKTAQVVTEVTLLHHTLRGLTDELHAALSDQATKRDPQKDKESELLYSVERRHPSSSFVDSIMVALTAEKKEDVQMDTSDIPDPRSETLFSERSAFTRIAAQTPKKNSNAVKADQEEEEEHSSVSELLSGLGSTVAELVSAMKLMQKRKDAQLQELHNAICGLQGEQQAATSRHQAEVLELEHQVSRLNNLADRGTQALQQRAQDEKTLTKLMADVKEAQEILSKHKTDNSELQKEVVELRRALQQTRIESEFLRHELKNTGGQSANSLLYTEEKLQLLKEVDRLKTSLQEVEQARGRLLERAKRHQLIHQTNMQKNEKEVQMLNNVIKKVRETLQSLPEVVKSSEQLQQLTEYIG